MTAIERAIASVGGVSALASAVGVGRSTVDQWKARNNTAGEKCPSIERATREAHAADPTKEIVICEQLRPEVEWEVLRLQIAPASTNVV